MAAAYSTTCPYDVVDDILQRLPLTSIIRFKSVSKQWKSLIESHSFVDRHLKSSRLCRKILLAFGCKDDGDGGDSPPFLFPEEDEEKEEEICYIGNCDASRISLTCDGLLCIPRSDSIQVCNPATRESHLFPTGESLMTTMTIPQAGTRRIPIASLVQSRRYLHHQLVPKFGTTTRSSFGFGKDEVTGAYKVVELLAHPLTNSLIVSDCNVLDLQTGLWRHVNPVPYRIFTGERSVYVNGSVHWFTVDLWEPNASRIVAFDLHLEEFRVVSHPNPNFSVSEDDDDDLVAPYFSELLVLRDRLSVSEMRTINVPHPRLDIWSMVDVQEERWVKVHSLCLCRLYQPQPSEDLLFTPLAIPDDQGEEDGGVLIIWDYRDSLFMSYPRNFLLNKVSAYARVVASSYFQTLVPVP